MKIYPADLTSEFPTLERCHIVELLNTRTVASLSVARCRVEPGITTQLHALRDLQEVYVVISGSGLMQDGQGSSHPIAPMDCVHIAPNQPQQVTNIADEDLIFLAICTERFTPDAYVSLEKANPKKPAA